MSMTTILVETLLPTHQKNYYAVQHLLLLC